MSRYILFLLPEGLAVAGLLLLAWWLGWIASLTAGVILRLLLLAAASLYPLVRPSLRPRPPTGTLALIGREGVLLRPAMPVEMVRLDGEAWRARSRHCAPLPAGTRVRVVAVTGLELQVEPVPASRRH